MLRNIQDDKTLVESDVSPCAQGLTFLTFRATKYWHLFGKNLKSGNVHELFERACTHVIS